LAHHVKLFCQTRSQKRLSFTQKAACEAKTQKTALIGEAELCQWGPKFEYA
jgi:hypothetical protein